MIGSREFSPLVFVAYLDRALLDYLQEKRHLDAFVAGIVVNCLALARPTITLRQVSQSTTVFVVGLLPLGSTPDSAS